MLLSKCKQYTRKKKNKKPTKTQKLNVKEVRYLVAHLELKDRVTFFIHMMAT